MPDEILYFVTCSLHHFTAYIVDNQYLKSKLKMKGNQTKDPNLVIISWVHNKNWSSCSWNLKTLGDLVYYFTQLAEIQTHSYFTEIWAGIFSLMFTALPLSWTISMLNERIILYVSWTLRLLEFCFANYN